MLIEDTEKAPRKALMELMGLSDNMFQKLKACGVFRPTDRGVYDLRTALKAWLKYHLDGAAPGDLTEARRLLTIAQRHRVELDTAVRRRELVPLDEAQHIFDQTMILIGGQLDGLGGRLAGELAGISDPAEVRAVIFNECRRIRDEASRQLSDWAAGPAGSSAASSPTAKDTG